MARIVHQRGLAKFIVCLFLWFIFAKYDTEWIFESIDGFVNNEVDFSEETKPEEKYLDAVSENEEERRIFMLISEHCLPKLVCELYAKPPHLSRYTDSEKSLMSLISSSFLGSVHPSKYHYAAHFGQLIQGFEGHGCNNMYPMCPFSGEDVQQIARKIPLK